MATGLIRYMDREGGVRGFRSNGRVVMFIVIQIRAIISMIFVFGVHVERGVECGGWFLIGITKWECRVRACNIEKASEVCDSVMVEGEGVGQEHIECHGGKDSAECRGEVDVKTPPEMEKSNGGSCMCKH